MQLPPAGGRYRLTVGDTLKNLGQVSVGSHRMWIAIGVGVACVLPAQWRAFKYTKIAFPGVESNVL